ERYGELREGTAVTIFVTEDFLPEAQVKANSATDQTIPVLKLNQTKKFITGIYPYSVMTSTFTPLEEKTAAIKVSHSMQEWCGHVYIQLNQRDEFDIVQHSYFEGEADLETTLPLTHLESDIWNVIRINPEELPTGEFSMLPSFEYFRMSHRDLKIHSAIGALEANDTITTYRITYPDLQRSLSLSFTTEFPHTINSWEETHDNGLVTKAERIKQLKTAYWSQNGNSFRYLRDSLGL
ncbi:MAG: septum formation inhibitor Maf, partial [Marinirhabdus sp.]|nr:septum formation inhibitor Maf [Marinirhabdus sp.]